MAPGRMGLRAPRGACEGFTFMSEVAVMRLWAFQRLGACAYDLLAS